MTNMQVISFDEFTKKISKTGASVHEVSQDINDFESIRKVSQAALLRMPPIGFVSVEKRLRAFFVVCEFLDKMVEDEVIVSGDNLWALAAMRFSNKKFEKAITMFDVRHNQFSIEQLATMPETASSYYQTFSDKRW